MILRPCPEPREGDEKNSVIYGKYAIDFTPRKEYNTIDTIWVKMRSCLDPEYLLGGKTL